MVTATKVRLTVAGALLAGTMALGAGQASAMPALDHGLATTTQAAQVEQVRWVCGPYRCWWRPGPYWGPRPYWGWRRPYWGGGWGWRRRWW